ncbi:FeoA family protein [Leptotrichia sp. oral taxon 212]|jgi:ferrous iron transporter A|uniref:FeoA family protein n=1 Tax=Leptotrichia sp. oral taxon 212 TaxID=712357 RepID=UPI0006A9AAA2|nr:FeoA family protein [Leptotrichia sp. oral taxon 212]ALA95001.1 iron transporter FeoA [Leptotrichia sp. oral taxon 212]
MNLLTAPINTPLKIIKVKMEGIQERQLSNMGFVTESEIMIISESSGNLIVNVKDCRVAIGKEIAQKIVVRTK